YVTVPSRSLAVGAVPPIRELVGVLGLELVRFPGNGMSVLEPVEAWSLPFFLDGLLRPWSASELPYEWRFYFDIPNRRGPSAFAQYLAFARILPFEASPLEAKSLSELVVGGGVSAALGYLTGHPLLVFEVSGG